MAKEVIPSTTSTDDWSNVTDTTDPTIDSTSVGMDNATQVTNPGSGGTGGDNAGNTVPTNQNQTPANDVTSATAGNQNDSSVISKGTPATNVDTNLTSAATTASTPGTLFQCYQGNCTGTNCHANESLYSTLNKVHCAKQQCSINVKEYSNGSMSYFDCNADECICQTKVTGLVKMCCTESKCNDQTLICSYSPRLITAHIVLVISFISGLLIN